MFLLFKISWTFSKNILFIVVFQILYDSFYLPWLFFLYNFQRNKKEMNRDWTRDEMNFILKGGIHNQMCRDLQHFTDLPAKHIVEPTNDIFHVEIVSRSHKKMTTNYQISFEEGLLDQHEAILQKKGENFMESGLKESVHQKPEELAFWRKEEDFSLDQIHLEANDLFCRNKLNQFKKDLETEINLSSFLEIVAKKVTETAGKELTYISMLVWEHYIKVKTPYFSLNDLEKEAENFATTHLEELFNNGTISFLNFSHFDEQILKPTETLKKIFEQFLKFWATTVLLVIEQYFENTYSETKPEKRERRYSLSDFQDEFSGDGGSFYGFPSKKMISFNEFE